jgi:hypothetical protein
VQLNSTAVVRLLRAAISVHGDRATEDLCDLAAASDISSADMMRLWREAFAQPAVRSIAYITDDIMQLPAFEQLTSAEVAELLHAAAQHYSGGDELQEYKGPTSLCQLEAAAELSSEQVLQPLQLVVRHSYVCTEALCWLPAAKHLSSDAVVQLLQAVIAGGSERSIQLLCQLAAAAELSSEQLVQVLEAAVQQGSAAGCAELCKLPAATQLSSKTLEGLLQAAQQLSSAKHAKCSAPLRGLLAEVHRRQQMRW